MRNKIREYDKMAVEDFGPAEVNLGICRKLLNIEYVPIGAGECISLPTLSNWKCELCGIKNGITIQPMEGNVPNRFWRFMQYILLGNKWTKVS